MQWTRQDTTLVALVWLGVAAVIVAVCLALPTPPPPSDPQFVPVLLDFFFGAILVAVVTGAAAIFCAFRFVQRLAREVERLKEEKRNG